MISPFILTCLYYITSYARFFAHLLSLLEHFDIPFIGYKPLIQLIPIIIYLFIHSAAAHIFGMAHLAVGNHPQIALAKLTVISFYISVFVGVIPRTNGLVLGRTAQPFQASSCFTTSLPAHYSTSHTEFYNSFSAACKVSRLLRRARRLLRSFPRILRQCSLSLNAGF